MNAQTKPELFSIEAIRLETLTLKVAEELVALSDPNDTVSVIKSNWIHITYLGRGSECYELSLSGAFTNRTRIAYQKDVVLRLNKIKSYILEEAA